MGVAGRGTPVEGEANVRGRQWAGWAAAAVPPLVSACVLAGGSSAWGRAAVAVGVAVLAAVAAALVAAGTSATDSHGQVAEGFGTR